MDIISHASFKPVDGRVKCLINKYESKLQNRSVTTSEGSARSKRRNDDKLFGPVQKTPEKSIGQRKGARFVPVGSGHRRVTKERRGTGSGPDNSPTKKSFRSRPPVPAMNLTVQRPVLVETKPTLDNSEPQSEFGRQGFRGSPKNSNSVHAKQSFGATPTGSQGARIIIDAKFRKIVSALIEMGASGSVGLHGALGSLVRRVTGPFRDLGAAFGKLVSRMADKLLTLSGRQTAEAKAAAVAEAVNAKVAANAEAAKAKVAANAEAAKAKKVLGYILERLEENQDLYKKVAGAEGALRVPGDATTVKEGLKGDQKAFLNKLLKKIESEPLDSKVKNLVADLSTTIKTLIVLAFTEEDHSQYDHLTVEYAKNNAECPGKEKLPAPLRDMYNLGLQVLKVNNSKERRNKDVIATQNALCTVIFNTPQGDPRLFLAREDMIRGMLKRDAQFAPEKAPEN